jgi:hypothetical protein
LFILVVVAVADLGDRYAVLARGLYLEPLDRLRERFLFVRCSDDTEMFGALANYIDGPTRHDVGLLLLKSKIPRTDGPNKFAWINRLIR